MPWHVYVLANADGLHYVGSTGRSPQVRLKEHNAGYSRWTSKRGPWRLVYWEAHDTRLLAGARERFLKTSKGRRLRDKLIAEQALSEEAGIPAE